VVVIGKYGASWVLFLLVWQVEFLLGGVKMFGQYEAMPFITFSIPVTVVNDLSNLELRNQVT
jgi:hypothetical protein